MRRVLDFFDRHLWLTLILVALILQACQLILAAFGVSRSFFGHPSLAVRPQVYSTIASAAGSLLGLSLAAVAILVSFGSRGGDARAVMLSKARRQLTNVIIALGGLLFLTLVVALVGLMMDLSQEGNVWVESTIFSLIVADGVGVVITGGLFAIAISNQ